MCGSSVRVKLDTTQCTASVLPGSTFAMTHGCHVGFVDCSPATVHPPPSVQLPSHHGLWHHCRCVDRKIAILCTLQEGDPHGLEGNLLVLYACFAINTLTGDSDPYNTQLHPKFRCPKVVLCHSTCPFSHWCKLSHVGKLLYPTHTQRASIQAGERVCMYYVLQIRRPLHVHQSAVDTRCNTCRASIEGQPLQPGPPNGPAPPAD